MHIARSHCLAHFSMRRSHRCFATCRTVIWLTTRLLSHRRHPALFARFDEANSPFALAFAFRYERCAREGYCIYAYMYVHACVRACVRERGGHVRSHMSLVTSGVTLGIRSHHTELSTPTTVYHRRWGGKQAEGKLYYSLLTIPASTRNIVAALHAYVLRAYRCAFTRRMSRNTHRA